MTNILRVGIIGTGVGIRTLLPGFRRTGRAEVVALSGSSKERAAEVARVNGIATSTEDFRALCTLPALDLICVASPNKFHVDHVECALRSGKAVLAEKPLAMTVDEVKRLVDLADELPGVRLVDHQLRFNPYLRELRSLIAEGKIGQPYHARIHQQGTAFADRDLPWSWSFDEHQGGGVRLAMGAHLVDLTWFLFGHRPVFSVAGVLDAVVDERLDAGVPRSVNASSFFSCQMRLERSLCVDLSASAAAVGESRFDVDVYGTEGELHFSLDTKLRGSFLPVRDVVVSIPVTHATEEERKNEVSIFKGSFVYYAAAIVEAMIDGDPRALEGAAAFKDAVPTQRVLDALLESALSNNAVVLDQGYVPGART